MPIPRPSYTEILDRIHTRLVSETNFTSDLDTSGIGLIQKIIAAELDEVWSQLQEMERQSNIATATGGSLDALGLMLGVNRIRARKASSTGGSPAVRFTNLGAGPTVIPSGTRVWRDNTPNLAFFTTEGATVVAGDTVEVHVAAAETGEVFNVGTRQLDSHNVPNASLTVTNILPIQNGSLTESDESYRDRLVQEFQRRKTLNSKNVVALIRSISGVRDAYLLELYRGAGTFDIIVIPFDISSTAACVSEAQAVLDENVPVGISAKARGPAYRQLDVKIVLTWAPRESERREAIRQSIRSQVISNVDNLSVEDGSGIGTFSTSQIKGIALSTDGLILGANIVLGLDGSPLAQEGYVTLEPGQRIALRSLSVE